MSRTGKITWMDNRTGMGKFAGRMVSMALAVTAAFAVLISGVPAEAAGASGGSVGLLKPKVSEAFLVSSDNVKYSYLYPAQGYTAVEGVCEDFGLFRNPSDTAYDYLKNLKAVPGKAVGAPRKDVSFVDIVLLDDSKFTYTFYESGVGVAYAEPGADAGKETLYTVNATAYQALLGQMNAALTNRKATATLQWLAVMRESKAASLRVSNQTETVSFEKGDPGFSRSFGLLRNLSPFDSGARTELKQLPDVKYDVTLGFQNGIQYDLQVNETNLLIHSTDKNFGLLYGYEFGASPVLSRIMELGLPPVSMNEKKPANTGKPVIYLYPEKPTDVHVKVDFKGELAYTYPAAPEGEWWVKAYPDGRLVNKSDGSEHYYLFWDGHSDVNWDFSKGFVVKGSDTESFLREKLAYLGLTPREYNDFIVYWLPEMQQNAYNLITFHTEQYEQLAKLTITPKPDSILRVHMVYKALEAPVTVAPQTLKSFERSGYAAVEWGGTRA